MTITYTFAETFDLVKYGKFCILSFSVEIPASKAVIIDETPYTKEPPAVDAVYSMRKDWYVITERFNWGGTHRPNKVYYELHQFGAPELMIAMPSTWKEGFYCGAKIKESNLDNWCTHMYATNELHVKLWNATGENPVDVYADFTVWFYSFKKYFMHNIQEITSRKIVVKE